MIRNIRLTNWRAFAQLDLPLTRPVTFFVAPNGVGKSSLVEAVRWALLGTGDDRSRGSAVRSGHELATVQIVVSMPGRSDIEVTRTLKRNGASTFRAVADGTELNEARYRSIMRDAWTADPALLDSLIFGPATSGKVTEFPIRDHLAEVFGIAPLLDAVATIKGRREALTARIKSLRDDLSGTDDAIAAAAEAVNGAEAEVGLAARERATAADAITELEASAALAEGWARYRRETEVYREKTQALVAKMADVLEIGDRDPRSAVEIGERDATAALDASIAAKNAAEVRAATAASAADLLTGAVDHCPTCLRPLTDHERSTALAAHGETSGNARTEIPRREADTATARQRVAAIAGFARALNELHQPAEPDGPDPGQQAILQLGDARKRASEATERHGALSALLQAAQRQLADLRHAAQDQTALVAAAREDLVLEIVQKTLNSVADRYMTERIEPLAHEIGRRWKLVFGTDGLKFDPDGTLSMRHGEVELALGDLSGGERSTAILVTRLMLAGSATRASTIWLDEPLEHLDPQRRAAVAQTIVRAAQSGAIGQILVTTYEEGLARRLAATAPDAVELTYARASPSS